MNEMFYADECVSLMISRERLFNLTRQNGGRARQELV